MRRGCLLGLVLVPVVLGCESDVEPSISESITARWEEADGTGCGWGRVVHAAGHRTRIKVAATLVTMSCGCAYGSRSHGWSCQKRHVCMSDYDVGALNPTTCAEIDSEPQVITSVIPRAEDGCTVLLEDGAGTAETFIAVECFEPGRATIGASVVTDRGRTEIAVELEFTADGRCTPPPLPAAEGDVGDGGTAADADPGDAAE